VEAGLPVVRSANSGISSVSDAAGRIVDKIPLGVRGVLDAPLPNTSVHTPFSKYGNSLFLALLAALVTIAVIPTRRW
jgi:apolipoprotein N-acyltransferase